MKILFTSIKFVLIVLILVLMPVVVSGSSPTEADNTSCFDEEDLSHYDESMRNALLFRSAPIIGGYWEGQPPEIMICSDSGVSEARLKNALRFWQRLGYEFGNIRTENRTYSCLNNGHYGEITILLFDQSVMSGNHLAVTRTHKSTITREIVKAEIFINRSGAQKDLVLEHEIGHALGWLHFNVKNHVMNSRYPLGGHSSNGLNRSDYADEVRRIKSITD